MKKYFFGIMIFILLTSLVTFQSDSETGFSEVCLENSKSFKEIDHHAVVLNEQKRKFISLVEFSKILDQVSKYDLDKKNKYRIEKSKSGKIEKCKWESLSKKENLISIEKQIFNTEIECPLGDKIIKGNFKIVDYLIVRRGFPKKIYLRIGENEIQKLSIDKVNYFPYFEGRLLCLDEAEAEFDKLK